MFTKDNPLRALNAAGQSVWCDHIHRGMITTGGLANMIEADDLRGITSNPSIFDKAISSTHEYDDILKRELRERPDQSSRELFFALAIEDIRDGADILRPVYDATGGQDGMISLEVSPDLAHDPAGTVREARELWERLSRPNLMVKVPATAACVPVIEQLIYEGLNINVTLLFSLERYKAVADAYTRGLERRLEQGQSVERIASVASFFISRVDSAMDPLLADKRPEWQGKVAISCRRPARLRTRLSACRRSVARRRCPIHRNPYRRARSRRRSRQPRGHRSRRNRSRRRPATPAPGSDAMNSATSGRRATSVRPLLAQSPTSSLSVTVSRVTATNHACDNSVTDARSSTANSAYSSDWW
jgi:transaldolase